MVLGRVVEKNGISTIENIQDAAFSYFLHLFLGQDEKVFH
tara:strand:+ start:429 stop:548 length:120 start_codon:yes stop_codon:yes gene_type:complete